MELPGGDWEAGEVERIGPEAAPFAARWRRLPGHLEHVFTHFTLRLALFGAAVNRAAPEGMVWVTPVDGGVGVFAVIEVEWGREGGWAGPSLARVLARP